MWGGVVPVVASSGMVLAGSDARLACCAVGARCVGCWATLAGRGNAILGGEVRCSARWLGAGLRLRFIGARCCLERGCFGWGLDWYAGNCSSSWYVGEATAGLLLGIHIEDTGILRRAETPAAHPRNAVRNATQADVQARARTRPARGSHPCTSSSARSGGTALPAIRTRVVGKWEAHATESYT